MMLFYKNSNLSLMLFIIFDKCYSNIILICKMSFEIEIVILINWYNSKAKSTE